MTRTSRTSSILILTVTMMAFACTSTAPPPPEPLPGEARHLVDPLTGFEPASPVAAERSSRAWKDFQSGRLESAERTWQEILSVEPDFSPALAGLASIAFARGQIDRAQGLIREVTPYTAVSVLRAEILASNGYIVEAAEALSPLVSAPETPSAVTMRYADLRERAVDQLVAEANASSRPEDRIDTLKRAVALGSADRELRLTLVEALISEGRFAEARAALEPSLDHDAVLNRVQAALAEIEIGEQKYQNAMRRYERLVDRTGDVIYRERLERAKRLWNESTFPQQFHLALRSPNITREQLAVLLFWRLPSIRFAQNLRQPPIVVDIAEVMGREELIRVLSLGLIPIDRTTRSVRPRKTVTSGEFLSAASTALKLSTSDPCAGASAESPAGRLHACGVDTMMLESDPRGFVTGATAAAILDQIAELARSAE